MLKEGTRVVLAMRRGAVNRVTDTGFWLTLDDSGDSVFVGNTDNWLEEQMETPEPRTLAERITRAINAVSAENGSNTPDFILAEYLTDCLAAFDKAVTERARWAGGDR